MNELIKIKQEIEIDGYRRLVFISEAYKSETGLGNQYELADTEVYFYHTEFGMTRYCNICGGEIQSFTNEFKKLINKYKI